MSKIININNYRKRRSNKSTNQKIKPHNTYDEKEYCIKFKLYANLPDLSTEELEDIFRLGLAMKFGIHV